MTDRILDELLARRSHMRRALATIRRRCDRRHLIKDLARLDAEIATRIAPQLAQVLVPDHAGLYVMKTYTT